MKNQDNATLKDKGELFLIWIDKLKLVASDKLNIDVSEIKINEEAAYSYFESGFTPSQCFREDYSSNI